MATVRHRFRAAYGAGGRHLAVTLTALVVAAYVVHRLGFDNLWDAEVWWQSILVWFLGAVLLHDLVLFPIVAVADRLLLGSLRRRSTPTRADRIPVVNHVRVPVLAVALLFLLFLPGIIEQGASTYAKATGQTQEPFLERWLVLSAAIFGLSAAVYGIRRARSSRAGSEAEQPQAGPG